MQRVQSTSTGYSPCFSFSTYKSLPTYKKLLYGLIFMAVLIDPRKVSAMPDSTVLQAGENSRFLNDCNTPLCQTMQKINRAVPFRTNVTEELDKLPRDLISAYVDATEGGEDYDMELLEKTSLRYPSILNRIKELPLEDVILYDSMTP